MKATKKFGAMLIGTALAFQVIGCGDKNRLWMQDGHRLMLVCQQLAKPDRTERPVRKMHL